MEELVTTHIQIPKEIDLHIKSIANKQYNYDERLKVTLATGLFVENELSLAEAAKLTGKSLYEFIIYLKIKGIPVHEYTEEEFEIDKEFIHDYQSRLDDKK